MLLTAYADTEAAIDAINRVSLDHYLMKPWDPPEEQLYPVLDDLLSDWEAGAPREEGVRVIGHRWSRDAHETKDFLARNGIPYRWIDVETDAAARRAAERGGRRRRAPAGAGLPGRHGARGARRHLEIAQRVGLRTRVGLAVLRPGRGRRRAGGARGGGLRRVGGPAHGAGRARGARRAGRAELAHRELPRLPGRASAAPTSRAGRAPRPSASAPRSSPCSEVVGLEERGPARVVRLAGGGELAAHAILIATGVDYRRLDVPGRRAADRRGRLLRRLARGGARLPGRAGVRRRRGELGRPGGGVLRPVRQPGDHPLPRRRPGARACRAT